MQFTLVKQKVSELTLYQNLLKMSLGYLPVLLYTAGFTLTLAEPSVEIVDIFGDVLMQIGELSIAMSLIVINKIKIQGKPLTVKCEVSDSVPGGVFTWEIGNEKIPSLNRFLFF